MTDDQKLYPTAQKYYDEALAIRRKVLGNENIQTANTLHNLAILAENQMNYSAARKYYEEALLIKRKVLGNEDPETATALHLLGSVADDQKDYPAARKYFEEALRVRREVLGIKIRAQPIRSTIWPEYVTLKVIMRMLESTSKKCSLFDDRSRELIRVR